MASTAYIASMYQSSVVNTPSQNRTYKYEVEGEGVVSERVAHRCFQRFNSGEESTKDFPWSGRSKLCNIENTRRVLKENPQKCTLRQSEEFDASPD